jgi:hypothetical protein
MGGDRQRLLSPSGKTAAYRVCCRLWIKSQTDISLWITAKVGRTSLISSANRLRRRVDQLLQPLGISYNHYATLTMLAADTADGIVCSPTRIGELLDVSKAQVTKLVDSLVAKGWAIRPRS